MSGLDGMSGIVEFPNLLIMGGRGIAAPWTGVLAFDGWIVFRCRAGVGRCCGRWLELSLRGGGTTFRVIRLRIGRARSARGWAGGFRPYYFYWLWMGFFFQG